ncbi:hypothetical protein [Fulvivirga imtechensis]|nr:hypothetical protein [Fulvivirga imtechensis]
MKIILTLTLSVLCAATSFAQEVVLKNLTPFDKVVISGNVQELRLIAAGEESPLVKIKGASESDVRAEVLAGTLHLVLKGNKASEEVSIYNGRLKRISGAINMKITGAEVIGGETGNYLVVSFNRSHGSHSLWATKDSDFHVHIPDIHVEIPDFGFAVRIPDMDFDFNFDFDKHDFDFKMDIEEFEGWRHEWKYNWQDHKEELKRWSEEMSEEMKEAMKEAKKELKRYKKD